MRIVVWVLERPEVVRELLMDRAARPRRLVPTTSGTFLLGPAPEDLRGLRDGMKVATTGDRPALGFAWHDGAAWLLVRVGGRVLETSVGATVPDDVARALASVLGVDDVRAAFARAQGRGLDRLRHVLELLGHSAEAQVLDWVDRAGAEIVPVHHGRWWERLIGEHRRPRKVGLQPSRHVTGAATQIAGMVLAATVAILYIPVASQVFPVWAVVTAVAVVVVAAVWGAVEGALMIVRWRRPEPFPFSDPLGLFASAG